MKRTSRSVICIFLGLLGFMQTSSVRAHPADVYTHVIDVALSEDVLSIKWEIKPGPMLVSSIWFEADTDQDEKVTQQEADLWAGHRAAKFDAALNGFPLDLQFDQVVFPSSQDAFQAGQEFVTMYFSVLWPEEMTSPYELVLHNGMEERKSLNWYYVHSEDDIKFETPLQRNSELALKIFTKDDEASQLITNWDSSMPSLSTAEGAEQSETASQPVQQNTSQEMLLDLIRRQEFSVPFHAFALAVSLVLGALHALTPGHGKTVVAAYLVGTRGTTWHAVVLGTLVTLTHTGSVLALGLVTLLASRYILPTSLIPVLEIISGLLIVGLGLYLFWQRFQIRLKGSRHRGRKYSLQPAASNSKKTTHVSRIDGQGPISLHHHGDGKMHSHDVPDAITWRSLIALGVSGGLVPCPDAIAILLVAIAINRILLGLSLILSFSLGLALVLIVIGLLMIHGSRLFNRFERFGWLVPFMPIVSAAVVLVLGISLTYGAYVRARGQFEPLITGVSRLSHAQVLYLAEDENKGTQLFMADLQDGTSERLTETPNGVVDYSLSPDQSRIAYILNTEDLDNEIRVIGLADREDKKLADCENAICSGLSWAPDGSRLVYENMSLTASNVTGLATLWWVDVVSGETKPLFQESQLPGANPRWSPDGSWLSFATSDGIRLYNLKTGEKHMIESILGAAANWSADGNAILYRDVLIRDNQFITQLFVYELSSQTTINMHPNPGFENVLAAWSPDGDQIAVVRRDLAVTRGDQIWLMDPHGRSAYPLTDTAAAVLHGSLNWSPDGNYLLYDLYDLDSLPLESSLQIIEVSSAKITSLNIAGYNPRWIWLQ
jgi:nickel/cobalt exporter